MLKISHIPPGSVSLSAHLRSASEPTRLGIVSSASLGGTAKLAGTRSRKGLWSGPYGHNRSLARGAVEIALGLLRETDFAGHEREERVVAGACHVPAGQVFGASLPDDYLAVQDPAAVLYLHAQPLGYGIAAELGRTS